jgi:hypothetical protein
MLTGCERGSEVVVRMGYLFAAASMAALFTAAEAGADPRFHRPARPDPGSPVFSVWRNLSARHVFAELDYVAPDTLDYRHAPAPLDATLADTCCAVRPGQPLTMVREGEIVGHGRVGSLFASREPSGGDSDRAWFSAVGLPGTAGDGRTPPFAAPHADQAPTGSRPDLYVVGDVTVEPYAPAPHVWLPGRDRLDAILAEAADRHLIHRSSFPPDRWWPAVGDHLPVPAWLPDLLLREGILATYTVPVGSGPPLSVQSVRLRGGADAGDGFVRVEGANLPRAACLGGGIVCFLRVDDAPYLLLRERIPGTGMWGCFVYRLWPDRAPEEVLADTSWST